MSDSSILLWINGLSGKVPAIDEFFKGVSNDYFAVITACLVMIWLWFATRDKLQREINQKAVIMAAISIGLVSGFMVLCNSFYFRPRPFDILDADSLNLIFYRPTDSSFPSNLTAVTFAIATPIFVKNKSWGSFLLGLAVLCSFGRVYLGIHYPLDILGGAALGVLAGTLVFGILRLLRPVIDYMLGFLRSKHLA